MNSIKEVLVEAGRYADVIYYLRNLPHDLESYPNYPLSSPYIDDDGKHQYNLVPSEILDQAKNLLRWIEVDGQVVECTAFGKLSLYIDDVTNMKLHNYAIDISHRVIPRVDMENIRVLLIIGNLCHVFDTPDQDFYVPKGWKKSN